VYKAGKATGDWHGQIGSDNFEKWVNEEVIANLETPSVNVMDSEPNHGNQFDKLQTNTSLKEDTLEYLRRCGVPCAEDMRKFTLFSLIENIRPKEKVYHIVKLFVPHGHTVVQLPP
jgi:hypothetical protein